MCLDIGLSWCKEEKPSAILGFCGHLSFFEPPRVLRDPNQWLVQVVYDRFDSIA